MSLYEDIRKEVSERRKKNGLSIRRLIDYMAWKNARDYQVVEETDDYWTAVETGYWPK